MESPVSLSMRLFLYNVILAIVAGPAGLWLKRHRAYHRLAARFAPTVPPAACGGIWIQLCSLGEANAARPLVEALESAFPDRPLLVTASTLTGYDRCRVLFGEHRVTWFPFDTSKAVSGFLNGARPQCLVLFETELWPNVLAGCHRAGVPVLLANGRLSETHLHRYQRFRWWFGPLVRSLDAACMQEAVYRDRLIALGVPEDRVSVTGSIKFDAVEMVVTPRERQRVRKQWGFRDGDTVLLFSSTRPGDEALASACWATLREEYPRLKLVIAPRHLDRMGEVLEPFSEPVVRRTQLQAADRPSNARVFVLDTMGELGALHSVADLVVVGGSLYAGVNGHNPLEAAALGVPVVFGPYMSNFAVAARVLVESGGARQVGCPEDLYLSLSTLLADSAKRRQMGTAARRAVLQNQGATEKTVARLRALLDNAL